jgi:hypothetical protein
MPPAAQIIALFFLGVSFCVIGFLVIRYYQRIFASDPESAMTTDVFFVVLFGEWGAPALLALLLCLTGVFCIFISGLLVLPLFT